MMMGAEQRRAGCTRRWMRKPLVPAPATMLPDRASKTSMRAGVVSSGRRPRKACLAVIVTLGATALAAVLGKKVSITEARTSKLAHEPSGTSVVATTPPPFCAFRTMMRGWRFGRHCSQTCNGRRKLPRRAVLRERRRPHANPGSSPADWSPVRHGAYARGVSDKSYGVRAFLAPANVGRVLCAKSG